MYEFGIVSTFFYHRGHSCSIPIGLQYHFEWVPYLPRVRSIYKIVRNIKSHPSASLNKTWSTVLQYKFYDRLLHEKRQQKKSSLIRVLHYLSWISHQYNGNNTPEVGDQYQLDDFLYIWIAQTPLRHPFM